ncbi:hypothetical protein J7J13_04390 [bacterium]|nr:hypothetical protein [bacterium]
MDTGKILLSGVIVWITSAAFGWLTFVWLFNRVYQIPPTNIWAAPETMMGNMPWINLIGFVAAIIFAGVYAYLYETFPGEGAKKGMRYGFIQWHRTEKFSDIKSDKKGLIISNTILRGQIEDRKDIKDRKDLIFEELQLVAGYENINVYQFKNGN